VQQKIYRQGFIYPGKGEMVRQELTSSLATGWIGKPHPEKGQIGKYKVARLLPG